MTTTLPERLNLLLEEHHDIKSAMARKGGITLASLLDILNGKSKNMKATTAYNLCQAYGVSLEWLLYGKKNPQSGIPENSADLDPVPITNEEGSEIAVLPWEGILPYKDLEMTKFKDLNKVPKIPGSGPHTMASRVPGDAMLPEFANRDIIYFDPDRVPESGDYVVARINGTILLRKYIADGADAFLTTTNPDWPGRKAIAANDQVEIIGTVFARMTTF